MKNQKFYNAGDLHDAYSLAENDLSWMATGFEQIRQGINKQKTQLEESGGYYGQLDDLIRLTEMFGYVADTRYRETAELANSYRQEHEGRRNINEASTI